MTARTARRVERGSALVLVVVLLLAMSLVSAAVVRLASQERINAGAQSSFDALRECANAAQALLWAQIGANGQQYYQQPSTTMTVTAIHLADGKEILAPAHIDGGSTSTPSQGIRAIVAGLPQGYFGDQDSTNTFAKTSGPLANAATWVTARCKDPAGRVHEVEFAFKFSL